MKDPVKIGPEAERHLFEQIGKLASGYPTEAVIGAAINVLVNAVRQFYPTRRAAEERMRELYGQHMELLTKFYDPATGRRRSVIPFDQVIAPKMFFDQDLVAHDLWSSKVKSNGG